MIYDQTPISHRMPQLPCNTFLVTASQKGWAYNFIVIAESADDAIARLKANAQEVILAVKKDMKEPWDFERSPIVQDPPYSDITKARELEDDITRWQSEMNDLEDSTDELSTIRIATLQENINEARIKSKTLRTPKLTGKKQSRFDIITERMDDVLNPNTQLSAQRLVGDRSYPVSYFDDSRSVTNYYP